jgi:hypothetical protein
MAAAGAIMRRVVTWGPVGLTVAAGAMLMGAEPVAPRPFPPLPVPPVERQAMPPFLARLTISGDPKMAGVFEDCVDPQAFRKSAQGREKARPADAPPLTGCTYGHEMRPEGSIHIEMSCDRAKGARSSFRRVSDGTLSDLRSHVELYDSDTVRGKTTTFDSHMVRLGPCPADLEPGQMRRLGGPILDTDEAARLREDSGGAAP